MSNRELDERQQRDQDEKLAAALGLTIYELEMLDCRIEPHTSGEGTLYGYNIYFEDASDPDIIAKIPGVVNGDWVRIGAVL